MNVDHESEDSVSETAEQKARDMLERMGMVGDMNADNLVELANLIAAVRRFTWDDVATIRANCEGFRYVARTTGANLDGEVDKLLNIADRIAALLPPRP